MSGIIAQNTLDNSGLIKAPAGGGAWNFISKLTASSSATLSFTSGIDSTYKEYLFTFNNIHPENEGGGIDFSFQGSIDSGSNYNVAMTTTCFIAQHNESDSATTLAYVTGLDLAQGTDFQPISQYCGNDNDQATSGTLRIFNPSSTVFVKHFIATTNSVTSSDYSVNLFAAGYFNTTSAIDAVQFKFASGDTDAGDICLYGITT